MLIISDHDILGELPFGLGSIYSITGYSSKFLTAVILVVNVVSDIFQILHMGPMKGREKNINQFKMIYNNNNISQL